MELLEGQPVKKGAVLFYLENPDLSCAQTISRPKASKLPQVRIMIAKDALMEKKLILKKLI